MYISQKIYLKKTGRIHIIVITPHNIPIEQCSAVQLLEVGTRQAGMSLRQLSWFRRGSGYDMALTLDDLDTRDWYALLNPRQRSDRRTSVLQHDTATVIFYF